MKKLILVFISLTSAAVLSQAGAAEVVAVAKPQKVMESDGLV